MDQSWAANQSNHEKSWQADWPIFDRPQNRGWGAVTLTVQTLGDVLTLNGDSFLRTGGRGASHGRLEKSAGEESPPAQNWQDRSEISEPLGPA